MGSFESESSVTIRGSGEGTVEMTSRSITPDISVELEIAGELFRIGFPSVDVCST